jgi:hypothetical protein
LETQQLSTKVAQLESRVATLEDEHKIVKGEVKQVLTDIRTAVLSRDNPFDNDTAPAAAAVTMAAGQPVAKVELVVPTSEHDAPEHEEPKPSAAAPATPAPAESRAPIPMRPEIAAPVAVLQPERPRWTLLTIAGLANWAEDAMRKLGALRVEILLDLCEAAGHVTPEARVALSRITELDVEAPEHAPTNNETLAILRQLDALINDAEDDDRAQLHRAA